MLQEYQDLRAILLRRTGFDDPTNFSNVSILDIDVTFTAFNTTENNGTSSSEIANINAENGVLRCPVCIGTAIGLAILECEKMKMYTLL